MCNQKTGYEWYIKWSQNQHALHSAQGPPGRFGGPGEKLSCGPSWFHLLTLWLRGSGGILPRKILKSQVPEMAKFCILEVCWQLYLYVHFNVIIFWATLGSSSNCPLPLGGLDSTCCYDFLWNEIFLSCPIRGGLDVINCKRVPGACTHRKFCNLASLKGPFFNVRAGTFYRILKIIH
jgi:hypothetical protein